MLISTNLVIAVKLLFGFSALLFFLLQLFLYFSQCAKVTQCGFFDLILDILDGFLCLVLFDPCFFPGGFFFLYLGLLPDTGMRNHDAFFIPVELNDHKLSCFFSANAFTIFSLQVTVGGKSFQAVRQLYDTAFFVSADNSTLVE